MHKGKSIMKKGDSKKLAFKAAFVATLPILTGFIFIGSVYGILMNAKGYGPLWSVLMSAIAYCGSMQFLAITMLATAFDPLQAFLLALMVNARHLFYGISMLSKYKGVGKIKPFLIYVLTDETFSIVCHTKPPEGVQEKDYYFFVSLLNYVYWQLSVLFGAVLGSLISFNTKGLDFVLTALFVVIFVEQWLENKNRRAALVGLACSAICLLLFGKNSFIIPSMIAIMVTLTIADRKEWRKETCY